LGVRKLFNNKKRIWYKSLHQKKARFNPLLFLCPIQISEII